MRDTRTAEVVWLIVLAVLVAAGGYPILRMLSEHSPVGLLFVAAGGVASVVAIRNGFRGDADVRRVEVSKGAAYLCAALLAGIAVVTRKHFGMPMVMGEVAIVFDVISILARRPRRETAAAGNTKST